MGPGTSRAEDCGRGVVEGHAPPGNNPVLKNEGLQRAPQRALQLVYCLAVRYRRNQR